MAVKASVSTGVASFLGMSNSSIAIGAGTPATNHITGASSSPSGTPITGSLYINTTGSAGGRIYWYFGGAWVAQSTP